MSDLIVVPATDTLKLGSLYDLGKSLPRPKPGEVVSGKVVLDSGTPMYADERLIAAARTCLEGCVQAAQIGDTIAIHFVELSLFDPDNPRSDLFYTVLYAADKSTIDAYIAEMKVNDRGEEGRAPLVPRQQLYGTPLYAQLREDPVSCRPLDKDSATMYVGTFSPSDSFNGSEIPSPADAIIKNQVSNFMKAVFEGMPDGPARADTFLLLTFSRPTPIDEVDVTATRRGGSLFLIGERTRNEEKAQTFDVFRTALSVTEAINRGLLAFSHTSVEHIQRANKERENQSRLEMQSFAHRTLSTIDSIQAQLEEKHLYEQIKPLTRGLLVNLWQTVARYRDVLHDPDLLFPGVPKNPIPLYVEIAATIAIQRATQDRRHRTYNIARELKLQPGGPQELLERLQWKPVDTSAIPIAKTQTLTFGLMLIRSLSQALYHSLDFKLSNPDEYAAPHLVLELRKRRAIAIIRNPGVPQASGATSSNDEAELEDMGSFLSAEDVSGPRWDENEECWTTTFACSVH